MCFLFSISMISAVGGFLFGYDTSVIAGANLYIDKDFPEITNLQKELIVSFTMFGAAIGSLTGGVFSDRYGRKPTIIIADIVFTLGALLMSLAGTLTLIIVG